MEEKLKSTKRHLLSKTIVALQRAISSSDNLIDLEEKFETPDDEFLAKMRKFNEDLSDMMIELQEDLEKENL